MPIQDDIPRSRITLTYRTTIEGESEEVELPLRLMVLGDLSRQPERGDLEEREVHTLNGTNLDDVMNDMDLSIDVEVPSIFHDGERTAVHYPIQGMKCFSPDAIAEKLPEVKSLFLMRTLLTELQANYANQRGFRNALKQVSQQQQIAQLTKELQEGGYNGFRLPAWVDSEAPAAAQIADAADDASESATDAADDASESATDAADDASESATDDAADDASESATDDE